MNPCHGYLTCLVFFSEVRPYAGSRDNITEFSTCALDGKVAIWQFDPSQLATELAGLKLN